MRPILSVRESELLRGLGKEAELRGPKGRKLAGICRDCDQPVEGIIGRAVRCAVHKKVAGAASQRKWRNSPRGRAKVREAQERRKAPEKKAAIRIREREYRRRPAVRAKRRAIRRRAALKYPERKREQHRRYREKYPDRVREQQQRANAKRAETKRAYMHRYATKYIGLGQHPKCADCEAVIEWTPGRGRPHKRCPQCDPRAWRRDQTGKHLRGGA